jgi:hypothetical protein
MRQLLRHDLKLPQQACQLNDASQNPRSPLQHLSHPILFPCTEAALNINEQEKKSSENRRNLQGANVISLSSTKKIKIK